MMLAGSWPKAHSKSAATTLILSKDLGYGETTELTTLLEEVSRMLTAYAAAILASDS
jgi:hypothetical protein